MQYLLLLLPAVAVLATEVTPVQKVIQLLDGMKAKGKREMHEEQVQYAKYEVFCEETLAEKATIISEATEKMEILEADIQKSISLASKLTNEIAELKEDVETSKADQEKATKLRKKERTDFEATHTDYTESIEAIGRALRALQTNKDKVDKTSLLQLAAVRKLKQLPADAVRSINAYLSGQVLPEEPAALVSVGSQENEAPKPDVYKSQSGGVISMLKSLLDKFADERLALEKEEAKAKHEYELLVQDLKAQEKAATKDKEEKNQFKAKQLESKASNEQEFEETFTSRDADKKYASDLKATCQKKAADMGARSKLRQEELEAIEKAKEIISGNVESRAEKHLSSRSKSAAYAFLRSENKGPGNSREQAARLLQEGATRIGSRMLSAAAVRLRADPIAKVKDMIQKLITKLSDKNDAEADKKARCDTQLAENTATRHEKTDNIEALTTEVDQLSSTIAKLVEDTGTLSQEVEELNLVMQNATKLREEEKTKNAATIKDAKKAQAAVAQALEVLRNFYEKAGGATALMQQSTKSHAGQPEIFQESYNGMGAENGGVVGLLEVIETDFANLEAETTAEEAKAKQEYNEFMEDSKVDVGKKTAAVEHKINKKNTKNQDLITTKADLLGTKKELDAAESTFAKLKKVCLDPGANFQERQAQRAEELKELEQALKMIQDANT